MHTFYRDYDDSIDYYQKNVHNTTNSDTTQDWGLVGNILVWGLIAGTLLSYTPQYYNYMYNNTL